MTTWADLIEEVEGYLSSYGAARDKVTTLLGGLNATDTTFTVDDGKQIDRGFLEIDSELIAVKSVDINTGIVTAHAWGRGARGTTATSHAVGAMVTSSPRFPRSRVKAEINEVVGQMFPDLFDVAVDESNTVNPTTVTYPLPADAKSIIDIRYQSVGPSKAWVQVNRYAYDLNADTTAFPTGKSVDIYTPMAPGRTIKLRYRRAFNQFVNETDTLASVHLSEGWRDIVRLTTVGRLLMGLEPGRLELSTVEAAARSAPQGAGVQPTAAATVGKQFLALAAQRVAQERRQLLDLYPSTQVRVG